jgi:hypothetical protein
MSLTKMSEVQHLQTDGGKGVVHVMLTKLPDLNVATEFLSKLSNELVMR